MLEIIIDRKTFKEIKHTVVQDDATNVQPFLDVVFERMMAEFQSARVKSEEKGLKGLELPEGN